MQSFWYISWHIIGRQSVLTVLSSSFHPHCLPLYLVTFLPTKKMAERNLVISEEGPWCDGWLMRLVRLMQGWWGRTNQKDIPFSGFNGAVLLITNKKDGWAASGHLGGIFCCFGGQSGAPGVTDGWYATSRAWQWMTNQKNLGDFHGQGSPSSAKTTIFQSHFFTDFFIKIISIQCLEAILALTQPYQFLIFT